MVLNIEEKIIDCYCFAGVKIKWPIVGFISGIHDRFLWNILIKCAIYFLIHCSYSQRQPIIDENQKESISIVVKVTHLSYGCCLLQQP